MDITLTQHPVGQGGMMSGLLQTLGGRFHWVYDCGSNQTDSLNREIDLVAAKGPIDCLFLSHLDSDHVRGIDFLLSRTTVREVVLPYLNDVDRLIAVAHDAAERSITGNFITFLNDIEGWFNVRGVERVSFIRPSSDEDEGETEPDMPDVGEGDGQSQIRSEWSHTSDENPYVYPEGSGKRGNTIGAFYQPGASLHLKADKSSLNWVWVPYAHRPSDKALEGFKKAFKSKFKEDLSDPDLLANILRDSSKLNELRKCYDLIWSNHNLVSMALYSGPARRAAWINHCFRGERNYKYYSYDWFRIRNGAIGWLGTGDMHLNIKSRRESFISHYRNLIDLVNVFGLPHHGAKGNFNPLLLEDLTHANQCIALAAKNSYGHPSAEVRMEVLRSNKKFIKIGSKKKSLLTWIHHLSAS